VTARRNELPGVEKQIEQFNRLLLDPDIAEDANARRLFIR
jgi:hypothetical protein